MEGEVATVLSETFSDTEIDSDTPETEFQRR